MREAPENLTRHSTGGIGIRLLQPLVMNSRSWCSWVSTYVIGGRARTIRWSGWIESDVLKKLTDRSEPWLR